MSTRQLIPSKPAPIMHPSLRRRGIVLQRKCACGATPWPSGECDACHKKHESKTLRRTSDHPSSLIHHPSEAPPIVHDVVRGSSQPLNAKTRALMEPRFGYDFSHVRVHADARAADSARSVSARAYTIGPDMVFGAGQYAPETSDGSWLLAHELAHVVQQRGATRGAKLEVGAPNTSFEQEANRAADSIAGGGLASVNLSSARVQRLTIQRQAQTKLHGVGCPVPELQESLNATGEALVVDGSFGPSTDAAVRRFQKAHPPLVDNGIVEPTTWAALHAAAPGDHGLPAGENTNSNGWGTGEFATTHRWQQDLTPATTSFHHCRVQEADPGGGTDTCHFPGSAYAPGSAVTGGTWDVDASNRWGDDYVGWRAPAVAYYRAKGRAPCSATVPQSMRVVRPSGDVEYQRNELTLTIGVITVSSARAGQDQIRLWL